MELSTQAKTIVSQITGTATKLGDLRKIARDMKRDHKLALELLLMDKKELSESLIDCLDKDIQKHHEEEKLQLIDWLMANQLAKDKKTVAFMEAWENSSSPLKRRVFWYYQARLRWVGQIPPPNSDELLLKIETQIEKEVPEVQWAMNFTAAQIGIFEEKYRSRCIALGENTGLYKDEIVAKNCTPNYLPKFIAIQVAKTARRVQ